MISFLHHYFDTYGVGEKTVFLHADNCGGQNKNRYLINYLAFRVLNKLHTEITIYFNVRLSFIVIYRLVYLKKKFKRTQVSDLKQLEKCVIDSTPTSQLIENFIPLKPFPDNISSIVKILEPIEFITSKLSSEKYYSLHRIIPAMLLILNKTETNNQDFLFASVFRSLINIRIKFNNSK